MSAATWASAHPDNTMTAQTTTAPRWRPSEQTSHTLMLYLGYCVLIIGAIALALSFVSVDQAARPYFGAASWAIPVLMDTTIGVLTFFSIVAELNGLRAPLARYSARALVGLTVYANIAPQHALYGKILHGAPPVVWVIVVAVAEGLIRRLAGLEDERRIEAVRRSLWLLRPAATWRLWRAMRIHQITTYAAALDRDAARAAVVGRLRLHHGRMWRGKAPLSERIALRLQGRDPQGVASILTDHADTAALLAAPAAAARKPGIFASENARETASNPDSETAHSGQAPATKRPTGRPKTGHKTAEKVATIAAKNPDATTGELAKKARLSERTVRRYLSPVAPSGSPMVEPVTHANGHDLAEQAA